MILASAFGTEAVQLKFAIFGGKVDGFHALDFPLGTAAVFDEVGDASKFQAVFFGELFEVGQPRHRAILVHDFADDGTGGESCDAQEVQGPLRMACADQHAAWPRNQREHVTWLVEGCP